MNTTGKRVLITGGSSRIGPPLAPALLAKGAKAAVSERYAEMVALAVKMSEVNGRFLVSSPTSPCRKVAPPLWRRPPKSWAAWMFVNNTGGVRAGALSKPMC